VKFFRLPHRYILYISSLSHSIGQGLNSLDIRAACTILSDRNIIYSTVCMVYRWWIHTRYCVIIKNVNKRVPCGPTVVAIETSSGLWRVKLRYPSELSSLYRPEQPIASDWAAASEKRSQRVGVRVCVHKLCSKLHCVWIRTVEGDCVSCDRPPACLYIQATSCVVASDSKYQNHWDPNWWSVHTRNPNWSHH